jgi:hypothetical protein
LTAAAAVSVTATWATVTAARPVIDFKNERREPALTSAFVRRSKREPSIAQNPRKAPGIRMNVHIGPNYITFHVFF